MPSKDEHLAKAANNHKFAMALKDANSTVFGWKLTILFYSALHYVEAYNAKFGSAKIPIICHIARPMGLSVSIASVND